MSKRAPRADRPATLQLMRVFGALLRGRREGKSLTLPQLAARTGIPASNLSNMEHGKRLPNLEHLGLLAIALDVEVRKLLPDNMTEILATAVPVATKQNSAAHVDECEPEV